MIKSTFESIKFDELYRTMPTRSIRPPQTDRTYRDRVWDKRRTFHESNFINLYDNIYFGLDIKIFIAEHGCQSVLFGQSIINIAS